MGFPSDLRGFKETELDTASGTVMNAIAAKARADMLRMTARAGTGHVGGALSSIDIFVTLWLCADLSVGDHVVVSHGHTSAAVYAVLGNLGLFNVEDAVTGFRKEGSVFEGHPSPQVPGVEWCSGSLGQGLSVGCGFALAERMKGSNGRVFVVMGDGEQQKGQLSEAREFAAKYGLSNLIAVIDCNGLQASGAVEDIMPQNIAGKFSSAGWTVAETDGHDHKLLYSALRRCYTEADGPNVLIAHTIMGKGVPDIEGNYQYHGKVLSPQQLQAALAALPERSDRINCLPLPMVEMRKPSESACGIKLACPELYPAGSMLDCRTAFGDAICSIAAAIAADRFNRMAVLDCDLAESVRLQRLKTEYPQYYVQCGIQEHNAATVAGALSKMGVLTFFVGFGVFCADETYAQHRMNNINGTQLKLVCTHCGLDVGEDGKTHQCIDPVSLLGNLYGFKVLIPADANQTIHMVRYMAQTPGNTALLVGRSVQPVLIREDGSSFFGGEYRFEYGKADWLHRGSDCTVITCGNMAYRALGAVRRLERKGMSVGVLNVSCPFCLDGDALLEASKARRIITYEDHNIRTGIGSLVGTWLAENSIHCVFRRLGVKEYGVSAPAESLYRAQGLDEDGLVKSITDIFA